MKRFLLIAFDGVISLENLIETALRSFRSIVVDGGTRLG